MGIVTSIKSLFKNIPLLFVIFVAILASRTLLFQSGYFNMHDDLQMMRQLQLEKCFLDGQIPCRWVPDMGYGFGFPLFNFYPPLPYLIGQIFRVMGASFVNTARYMFAASFFVSGIAMYYFSKEFLGKLGGVVSAVFYIWAPYHAVDIYVRGAANEAWALAWFPLLLLTSYKLIYASDKREGRMWGIGLALSYAALLLTHNLMVLIFTPVLGVWVLLHLWQSSYWKKLIPLALSGLWGIALAAFSTLPALVENKYTQLESQLQGYYNYTAHFVSVRQLLFSRFWGYGPSVWLEEDGMSFQIGHLHWIVSLFVILVVGGKLVLLLRNKKGERMASLKNDKLLLIVVFMFVVGWFSAFLTHPKSIFVWTTISQLRFTQFPWRFLTLTIFGLSFVVGAIPALMTSHKKIITIAAFPFKNFLAWTLVVLLIVFNWNYFLPEYGKLGSLTDEQKFTDFAWDLQQTAGIYDYLPSTAVMAPRAPMKDVAEVLDGDAVVSDQHLGTDWGEFRVDAKTDSTLRFGIFQFPGWKTYVDGVEVTNFVPETEEWGRMYIDLPSGVHNIRAEFTNTPIRTLANGISLVGWGILGYCVFFGLKQSKTKK